ncbi:MAG: hypothetical protein ABI840_08535 [bacterium]
MGNSGVIAYETGADYIKVKYIDNSIYLYTNDGNGKNKIDEMKKLAASGNALSTFISKNVKKKFPAKLN